MTCPHGHEPTDHSTVNDDGITACCGAYTSIFTDDGVEYCKCCYGGVHHQTTPTNQTT